MGKSPTVYAVIVTWNGAAWISRAVDSLQRSSYPIQIIVVDNHSADQTGTILKKYQDIEILQMSSNLGFGKANNLGIQSALSQGADYLFLMNQDAWIEPSTIKDLVRILENHPNFGILSPLQLNYEGTGTERGFLHYIHFHADLISDAFLGRLDEVYETNFINAAIWLVRSVIFNQIGGFDPLFFMYGEDKDFCNRAKFHGFKIGLAPKVLAYHWHGGDLKRPLIFKEQLIVKYSELLWLLKRPDRAFHVNCLFLAEWVRRTLICLLYGEFKGALATLLSLLKAITKLSRIFFCYEQSKMMNRILK